MSESTADHEKFMRRALNLAKISANSGNHPFGAILVRQGYVVVEGENTVVDDDCTHHAELNLVRTAEKTMSDAQRAESTLYTSTEPCVMCAGAIYWAGIRRVVYSVPASRLVDLTGYGIRMGCEEIFARADQPVEVIGPVLEEEGFALHQGFWET